MTQVRLNPNEGMAFKAEVRKLKKNPEDKIQVLNSEKKLQELGFVDFVNNLSKEERIMIESSCHKYFIPWRAVWNKNSLSTTCRLFFDASVYTRRM